MGQRRDDPRHGFADDGTHRQSAGERGRLTPFVPRRGRPWRTPRPVQATPEAMRRGGVGVDLRAGRNVLPPIPSLAPQRAETPPRENPGALSAPPQVATAPTLAAPSRIPAGRPARPHHRTRRMALIALLLAQVLVAGAAAWALTTPTFETRRVAVAGTSDALVVQRIEAMPLTGCNLFRCDTAALARQVERLPAVASATVSPVYPDGLLVRVTPRQPAVLWHTSAAELVIASDGTALGAITDDPAYAHLTLPQIEDGPAAAFGGATPAAGQRMDPLLVNMAGQLRMGLQGVLGAGWTLDYDAQTGLVAVNGDGSSSMRVLFGRPRDAAQAADDRPSVAALLSEPSQAQVTQGARTQLAELHALLHLLAGKGQQVALIDLRWGAHPYYRLAG